MGCGCVLGWKREMKTSIVMGTSIVRETFFDFNTKLFLMFDTKQVRACSINDG
jgi:hypothetical protein